MRGKYELWVIIFLQVVALEAQQPRPNLLEILLIMGTLAVCKKVPLFWKEERDGSKRNQHYGHLHHARRSLCDERRRKG